MKVQIRILHAQLDRIVERTVCQNSLHPQLSQSITHMLLLHMSRQRQLTLPHEEIVSKEPLEAQLCLALDIPSDLCMITRFVLVAM